MKISDFDPISIEIFEKQIKKTALVVLAVFSILILRLWFLQIVTGSVYRTKSEQNRIRLQELSPFRGRIFDRNGDMLVGNRPSYDLHVIPEEIQDRQGLLKSLDRLIGLDEEMTAQKLEAVSHRYPFRPICLKRDISRDELAVIETYRFNLPGVIIMVKPQRHYVFGDLAAHLIGYLGEISEEQLESGQYPGSNAGDLIGMSGVERKWQRLLNGMPGGEQVEVDAAGRIIRVVSRRPPISGLDVSLTIDRDIQALAEENLLDKRGAIVAMDPMSGKVMALASSPSFDPNLLVGGMDRATWEKIATSQDFPLQNRAVSGQYPPGSVFKIVVALAGLQEGIADPEETIVCRGGYALGRKWYSCWKSHGPGINLYRALVESCDTYFYEIGRRLGPDKIADYAMEFGFGKALGLDVGQEKAGLVPTTHWKLEKLGTSWQAGETLSMSIGQSFVLVTPIQMCEMISAVFNGGVLYRPQVTKWVGKEETKKVHEFEPEVLRRLGIRREYLEVVKRALMGVVNEPSGTGSRARLAHIKVAGKTGTAQVVTLEKERDFSNGGVLPLKYRDHAWFVALAPVERPRIALAIVIEHGGQGGRVAAPIAGKILKAYFSNRG